MFIECWDTKQYRKHVFKTTINKWRYVFCKLSHYEHTDWQTDKIHICHVYVGFPQTCPNNDILGAQNKLEYSLASIMCVYKRFIKHTSKFTQLPCIATYVRTYVATCYFSWVFYCSQCSLIEQICMNFHNRHCCWLCP